MGETQRPELIHSPDEGGRASAAILQTTGTDPFEPRAADRSCRGAKQRRSPAAEVAASLSDCVSLSEVRFQTRQSWGFVSLL